MFVNTGVMGHMHMPHVGIHLQILLVSAFRLANFPGIICGMIYSMAGSRHRSLGSHHSALDPLGDKARRACHSSKTDLGGQPNLKSQDLTAVAHEGLLE